MFIRARRKTFHLAPKAQRRDILAALNNGRDAADSANNAVIAGAVSVESLPPTYAEATAPPPQ